MKSQCTEVCRLGRSCARNGLVDSYGMFNASESVPRLPLNSLLPSDLFDLTFVTSVDTNIVRLLYDLCTFSAASWLICVDM